MFTDPPRNIAEAMQQGYDERMVRERMNAPMNGSSRGPIGIGNLGGWAMASGMVFAVVGFIMGKDLASAIIGGLFGAGLLWVPSAFLRKSSEGGASRSSVIGWTLGGVAGGAALAVAVALVADVIFLKEMRVGNMIVNYAILGGLLLGGYRLSRR